MAAPTIGGVLTLDLGTTSTGSGNITLSASNDRVLAIAYVGKDNTTSFPAVVTEIVVDAIGVNSKFTTGEVVRQGTVQLAQEGQFSSVVDAFFVLDTNLPTGAGTIQIDVTMDASTQWGMWIIIEIISCPDQAYDNIVENFNIANVSAAAKFSASITPTVDDCLVIDFWGTSHSAIPTFTSTESQVAAIGKNQGGAVCSQFTQTTAAAKTMEQESSALHQRRAWKLFSFAGTAAPTATVPPLRRRLMMRKAT